MKGPMKGIIYLEDGTIYKGKGFGFEGTRVGELVFNTAMTGYQKTLTDPSYKEQIIAMEWGTGLLPAQDYYAVKVPVFSDAKLTDVDVAVGPEMKSTGEVIGIDKDLDKAIYKGFLGAGGSIPVDGSVFVSLRDHDNRERRRNGN